FLLADGWHGGDLHATLSTVAARTFHRVSVDGDTSPNDTLFLLANERRAAPERAVAEPLERVSVALARQLAADGEGASRLVTIEVRGAPEETAAARVGRTIATSMLTKTAIAGRDPNWGRLVAAAGRCGIAFDPGRTRVWVGGVEVFSDGRPHPEREAEASRHLQHDECVVLGVDLGVGEASADVWTCDLTADYVRINADYRT
ncbi:MAG TPA: hypothetical protein ENI87_08370, partial [bacterium]|nr:hypothetical protein [bacterium]